MAKIAVLGSGSWGTALSIVLADNDHEVRIWGRSAEQIRDINENHLNQRYLPEITLSPDIVGTTSLKDALFEVEAILLVVPTKAMRSVLKDVCKLLNKPMVFIHASKGIEPETHYRISEIIEEEIPANLRTGVVALSGPSHAEEVSLRQPTTVTSSSLDPEAATFVQDLFMNQHFVFIQTLI